MRHQEKGKGLRQDQREGAGGAHRAALALAQRRDRQSASPSYEAIAEAAGCARGTVYEAIRALEQVGVLSWVNRIKRVREYVPRPVRQPGATTLRGAGSPAALPVAWPLARLAGKTASAAKGDQTARTAAPATRCNDVAWIGQFRDFAGSMSFGPPPRGA